MDRVAASIKTRNLLTGRKQYNAEFYKGLFNRFSYSDTEMTPISPAKFGNVNPNNYIIITEDAYNDLVRIREITELTDYEVSYFMFGEERSDGSVLFDIVVSSYNPESRTVASFDSLTPVLQQFINGVQQGIYDSGNKQVVCHGHTHGTSPVADNFSFGDMISYVQFSDLHPLFRSRKVETVGMLMPPCGDFNFVLYENNPAYEGFYTFPEVYLQLKSGAFQILPAYHNGDYLVNDNRFGSR